MARLGQFLQFFLKFFMKKNYLDVQSTRHLIFKLKPKNLCRWTKTHQSNKTHLKLTSLSQQINQDFTHHQDLYIDWAVGLFNWVRNSGMSHITQKRVFGDFRPGNIQTSLLNYRSKLESWNFGYSKYTYHTIYAANNNGADQTAQTRRLICTFVVHVWHKTHFRMLLSWLLKRLLIALASDTSNKYRGHC